MATRKRNSKTTTSYAAGPRDVIRQAASDLQRGLANTDCRVRDKTSPALLPPA